MKPRPVPSFLFAVALAVAGCASPAARPGARVVALGEQFDSPEGRLFVLRIQDEYRVIRCVPEGPIAGCYEDVFAVPGDDVQYNRWMPVEKVPNLEVAILSTNEVAFVIRGAAVEPR